MCTINIPSISFLHVGVVAHTHITHSHSFIEFKGGLRRKQLSKEKEEIKENT